MATMHSSPTQSMNVADSLMISGDVVESNGNVNPALNKRTEDPMRRGFRKGDTCASMADSCQCMAKTTTVL